MLAYHYFSLLMLLYDIDTDAFLQSAFFAIYITIAIVHAITLLRRYYATLLIERRY